MRQDVPEGTDIGGEGERLLAEARAAQRAAEEALRVRDHFLAIVSHELRTPLNTITAWTELLRANEVDAALLKRGLKAIERSAQDQARLISDLLDAANVMAGKVRLECKPSALDELTRHQVEALIPRAAEKGVLFETVIASRVPVTVDPQRIEQAIFNVLSNALQFTPAGGTVRVHLDREGPTARLVVSDTGEGIDPSFLPYVFERFRQADATPKRAHRGVGLGLALAKDLLDLHGGTVEVTSEGVGKGCVFTIRLPCETE